MRINILYDMDNIIWTISYGPYHKDHMISEMTHSGPLAVRPPGQDRAVFTSILETKCVGDGFGHQHQLSFLR